MYIVRWATYPAQAADKWTQVAQKCPYVRSTTFTIFITTLHYHIVSNKIDMYRCDCLTFYLINKAGNIILRNLLTPLRPPISGPRLPRSAPMSDPPPSPSSSPPCMTAALVAAKCSKHSFGGLFCRYCYYIKVL